MSSVASLNYKLRGWLSLLLLSASPVFSQGAGNEWEILNQEVESLIQQGQYDRAVVVAKKALEVAEEKIGPDHPAVATSLNNLALLYYTQGQYAEAEPLYNRAMAIAAEKQIRRIDRGETVFVNRQFGWATLYPFGWWVDSSKPTSVTFRSDDPPGWFGIHSSVSVKSLEELVEFMLPYYPPNRFKVISRNRMKLPNGEEAIVIEHHIGTGRVGKSLKIFTTVGDRGFVIDAETYLKSWSSAQPYFDRMLNMLKFSEPESDPSQ